MVIDGCQAKLIQKNAKRKKTITIMSDDSPKKPSSTAVADDYHSEFHTRTPTIIHDLKNCEPNSWMFKNSPGFSRIDQFEKYRRSQFYSNMLR